MSDEGRSRPPVLNSDQIGELFPFQILVDRSLTLRHVGRSLAKICPDAVPGAALTDVFAIRRPECVATFDGIIAHDNRLFVLDHPPTGLTLRGQIVTVRDPDGFIFLGSPWVTDPARLKQLGLVFNDFALFDPIADLIQLLQAQRSANEDLAAFNEKLTEQRARLSEANENLVGRNAALIEAEGKLRSGEADARKLGLIAARTDNAVILTDTDGAIEWVNEGFTRLTEYTLDEVRGRKPGDILQGPDTDARTVRFIRERLAQQEGFIVELVNYSKSGRKYRLAIEVQPIRDDAGRLVNYMAIERDITAKRAAEDAVRESGERLELAVEAAGLGLWYWQIPSDEIVMNDRLPEMWGYSRDEVQTRLRHWPRYVHPDDRARIWAITQDHVRARTAVYEFEGRILAKDGSWKWALSRGRILERNADGRPVRVMGVHLDVDETKRSRLDLQYAKEEAEWANHAKSEFLANMSHEIRTPLNAIVGLSELLSRTELSERQRDYTTTLLRSTRVLHALVNDLLDFSKIESGRLTLSRAPFDVWGLAENMVGQFADEARVKGLILGCAIQRGVPRMVEGDGDRLGQILINLLGNSLKFTKEGTLTLAVSQGPGTELRFDVVDSGIGMNAEAQKHIFEAFTQADNSIPHRFGGTGLGLAICRELVELMQGRIGVESTPGGGSRFWFSVPMPAIEALEDDGPRPPRPRRAALWGLSGARASVLRRTLEPLGIEVADLEGDLPSSDELAILAGPGTLDLIVLEMRDGADLAGFASRCRLVPQTKDAHLLVVWAAGCEFERVELPGPSSFASLPLRPSDVLARLGERDLALPSDSFSPPTAAPGSQGRVLLVEDNAANQLVAREFLRILGWDVVVAPDGPAALHHYGSQHFDAILMDCQMPGMDGYSVTREIRRLEGAAAHVPIIALTASATLEDRGRCLAAGMDDYIYKPVRLQVLQEALERSVRPATVPTLEALIDLEQLARLGGLKGESGRDLLADLIDMFAESAPASLRGLREACASSNDAQVHLLAHTLKGTAATLGASTIASYAEQIEGSARAGRLDDLLGRVSLIEEALPTTLSQLASARVAILAARRD